MTDITDAAVPLTTKLVAVDSVNPGLVPGAAGEAAMVGLLRARLDRAGFVTDVVEATASPDDPAWSPGEQRT